PCSEQLRGWPFLRGLGPYPPCVVFLGAVPLSQERVQHGDKSYAIPLLHGDTADVQLQPQHVDQQETSHVLLVLRLFLVLGPLVLPVEGAVSEHLLGEPLLLETLKVSGDRHAHYLEQYSDVITAPPEQLTHGLH